MALARSRHNVSCETVEPCAFCNTFAAYPNCTNDTLCEVLHYVHRSTMLDARGAGSWLNCTGRRAAGDFCSFRFVVDAPRDLVYTDVNSKRCTGNPAVVAALVAGALLLLWLVLAVGLGLPRRLVVGLRGRDHGSVRSGSSTRASTRGSTRNASSRRNYSVRSN